MWPEKDFSYLFLKESEHFSFLFSKTIDWNYNLKVCKCGWRYREPKSVHSTVTNSAIPVIKAKFHLSGAIKEEPNMTPFYRHFTACRMGKQCRGGDLFRCLLFCSPWELKTHKSWQHCTLTLSAASFLSGSRDLFFCLFYHTFLYSHTSHTIHQMHRNNRITLHTCNFQLNKVISIGALRYCVKWGNSMCSVWGAQRALRILELCSVMTKQTILLQMLYVYLSVIHPERIHDSFFLLTELCI